MTAGNQGFIPNHRETEILTARLEDECFAFNLRSFCLLLNIFFTFYTIFNNIHKGFWLFKKTVEFLAFSLHDKKNEISLVRLFNRNLRMKEIELYFKMSENRNFNLIFALK